MVPGLDLEAEQLDQVLAMQVDVACTAVRIEHALLEVAEQFSAAEVSYAVLKGCATAHLDYVDPNRRQFGDVDLLVHPRDMERVQQLLWRAGWRQAYPLPRYHDRFTHAITFRRSGIAEIDLHQRIGHRALGLLVPTSELLAERVPLGVADRQLWALSDVDRLIHAATHAVASRGSHRRLSTMADVLVLGSKLTDRAADVLERAGKWRILPIVEMGLRTAFEQAMLPLQSEWSDHLARPTGERQWLVDRAYLGERRRPATEELAFLRQMPGWRDRLLYLYGHLRMDSGPGSGGLRKRLRYLRSRLRQRS